MMGKRKRAKCLTPSSNGKHRQDKVPGSNIAALRRQLFAMSDELEAYRVQTEHLVKIQQELEQSRDRYADLFDFAPVPCVVLDRWGLIVEANLPFAAFVEHDRSRVIGTPLRHFATREDRRTLLSHMHRCRAETGRITSELRLETRSGALVPVELTSRRALETYADGEHYPTAVTDLSERQRATMVRNQLIEQLMNAEEGERQRLSRELHDVLGQHVTALLLGLRSLESGLALDDDHAKVQQLISIANMLGEDAHRLALNLRPTALDDLGLESALAGYIDDWSVRAGVQVNFHASLRGGRRLPPALETMFYRVVQEALTNVARHAQASHVNVLLNATGVEASVIIEDDGRGISELAVEEAARNNRLGLAGMRERVQITGGTLEIESATEKGTTLYVRVPLKGESIGGAA